MKSALSSQPSALSDLCVGTGALARPSRAKLGSRPRPRQLWIRHVACWFALLLLFAAFSSAEVLKIAFNDAIQPVTAEYIGRALDLAAANHDQAVLIEINTPGGLVDSTRDIRSEEHTSELQSR